MRVERSNFKTLKEAAGGMPPDEVVPGFIDEGVVLIAAKEGTGKTFLGVALAVVVAGGRVWRERNAQQGMVVYCIAEGTSFFGFRVTTAVDYYKSFIEGLPLYIFPSSFNLRVDDRGNPSTEAAEFVEIVKALEAECGKQCKLIIFDTLNLFMPGGDENEQKDAGALIKGAHLLREALGCTIIFMHHMRKGGDATRGSTVLTANVDEVIVCKSSPDDKIQLWTTKDGGKRKDRDATEQWIEMREMPMTRGWGYAMEDWDDPADNFVCIDQDFYDEEGNYVETRPVDRLYTRVAVPVGEPTAEEVVKTSTTGSKILELLNSVGPMGVRQLVRDTCKSNTMVYKTLDKLIEAGRVERTGDKKYRAVVAESPFGGEK